MSRTLVTHVKPHLDDIAGFWLYRKYVPGWEKARFHFIPTTAGGAKAYGGKPVDIDPNIVHVGVCRGKYDEHKGNIGECATSLIYKDLKKKKLLPSDPLEKKALAALVAYVLEGDLGKRKAKPDLRFEFSSVIMGIPDSILRTNTGLAMLDGFLATLKDEALLDRDWRRAKEFDSQWGKGIGIASLGWATNRAYSQGFVLVVQVDPKRGYRSIRAAADSSVDLTAAYEKAKKLEPKADWYFHHSKRMLICGSEVAPQSVRSKLTLAQMIGLVRK